MIDVAQLVSSVTPASVRGLASRVEHGIGRRLGKLRDRLPLPRVRHARSLGGRLSEVLYVGQQLGLAMSLGLLMRGVQKAMSPHQPQPAGAAVGALTRRFRDLLDADLDNAARGLYPRQLLFQLPVTEYLSRVPEAFRDAPRYLRRFRRRGHDELPSTVERGAYPRYYLRNFHWQTDGWLSERSARMYDFQVELLFGGTADVMRRMAIPPLVEAAAERGRDLRVLDLACGTGRFLLQLHAALPGASLTGVDLSPPYVARARRVHGRTGARFFQGNAEALPLPDGSFDAITSVFLFHELPADARRNVIREAYRLLAPSGRLVILDSAQLSESAPLEFFLRGFEALYHEPYFKGYIADDLGAIMEASGFVDVTTTPQFVSKLVVGRKPDPDRVH